MQDQISIRLFKGAGQELRVEFMSTEALEASQVALERKLNEIKAILSKSKPRLSKKTVRNG